MKILRVLFIILFTFNNLHSKKIANEASHSSSVVESYPHYEQPTAEQDNLPKAWEEKHSFWQTELERLHLNTISLFPLEQEALTAQETFNEKLQKATQEFMMSEQHNPLLSLQEQLDSLFKFDSKSLMNKNFTPAQTEILKTFTSAQWDAYLALIAGEYHTSQVFNFYSLYQFPNFRELVKRSSGYDSALCDLSNRLDSTSPAFDKNLYYTLAQTPAGVALYDCMQENQSVQDMLVQKGTYFADHLSKIPFQDQFEQVKLLSVEQSTTNIRMQQAALELKKLEMDPELHEQKIAQLRFFIKSSQFKSDVLNQKIVQSRKLSADWKQTSSFKWSEKSADQLQDARKILEAEMVSAHQEYDLLGKKYRNAMAEFTALQNTIQKGKAGSQEVKSAYKAQRNIETEKIRPLILQRDVIRTKLECLKEQHQQVQVYEYIAQGNHTSHSQARTDALHGKSIAQPVELTQQALKLLHEFGLDSTALFFDPTTTLQAQSQQEVIELLNRSAAQQIQLFHVETKDLFDATGQLARAALDASKQGDIIRSWALTDIGNCALDYTTTPAFIIAQNPIQSTAIRDGIKQAAHNINHAVTHPIETITNCLKSAVILADITDTYSAALDNSGLSSMPLEKQIEKQAHISQNLDLILDKMRSISSDDMVRELVASGLEAGAFSIALRCVGTISSLAKKQLQATAELIQDATLSAKVLSTAEGLKISINALDAEIVKIEESIAQVAASTAENSVKTPLMQGTVEPIVFPVVAEALAEQAGVSTVASAADIGLIAQKVSLQHLDPSVGNIAKLEYAVEMFKDTPGAVHPDSPITRLLRFGNSSNPGELATARGSAYELEVAYDLAQSGENIVSLGNKLPLKDLKTMNIIRTLDIDIETSTKFIECKNWNWKQLSENQKNDYITKIQNATSQLQKIARQEQKEFVLYFKYQVPEKLSTWLTKRNISFSEGIK